MAQQDNSGRVRAGRRDRRHGLAPGAGSVEFPLESGKICRGILVEVSLAGLTFRSDVDPGMTAGSRLSGVIVRLADSVVPGDLINIRACRLDDNAGFASGCLFYPHAGTAEATWVSMLSGPELRIGTGSEPVAPSLVIRCGSCHGSMRVAFALGAQESPSVTCRTCSKIHALDPGHELLHLEAARNSVREFALRNGIDMAGAYSVRLAIMTLDEVRDMFGSIPGTVNATLASEGEHAFDPDFRKSVETGVLPVDQAIQRGNRQAFASRLAERHRLSMELALAVADNHVSLLNAVRRRAAEAQAAAPAESAGRSARLLFAALFVVVVLAGVGSFETRRYVNRTRQDAQDARDTAAIRQRLALATTRVVKDGSGRVTEVHGSDPQRVLLAYCRSFTGHDRPQPLEITPLQPPEPDVRFGIFSDRQGIHAIRIHRRGGARNWVVGGTGEPILVSGAPPIAPGTSRIPVGPVTSQDP